MKNIADKEKEVTVKLLHADTETIYALLQTERDPIFGIPYYALYVKSCQEYMRLNSTAEIDFTYIGDIRNQLKVYSNNGFNKSKTNIAMTDTKHDTAFREKLRLKLLRKFNCHYNLGTHWTDEGYIVGDTQQIADFLNVADFFAPKSRKKLHELGILIGAFVHSMSEGLSTKLGQVTVVRKNISLSLPKYCDFNTNRTNSFWRKSKNKELSLFYLHLLGNIS